MDIVLFNQSNTVLTPEQDLILIDFFGYSSGVFVGITLLPQVIKVFKTQSTKDLSHIFLALSLLASVSKFIYGILINQLPIVVTAPIIGIETLLATSSASFAGIFSNTMAKQPASSSNLASSFN